jgi:hypothetical protein
MSQLSEEDAKGDLLSSMNTWLTSQVEHIYRIKAQGSSFYGVIRELDSLVPESWLEMLEDEVNEVTLRRLDSASRFRTGRVRGAGEAFMMKLRETTNINLLNKDINHLVNTLEYARSKSMLVESEHDKAYVFLLVLGGVYEDAQLTAWSPYGRAAVDLIIGVVPDELMLSALENGIDAELANQLS